jgi:glucan endo-1,3-alpha-glucosidase
MNVWPQGRDSDAQRIAGLISKYANHPNMFKMNDKPFVSTFSGDQWSSSFGNSMCGGWNTVRSNVPGDFYFVPAFFFPNGQTIAGIRDCVEGLFQWNSAWSLDGAPVSAAKDLDWAIQLGVNKTYMAGISPTFFTHYPVDGLNKNWVYRSENNYAKRWEQATAVNAPMVQVITWNDYGESHYIGQRPSSVQLEPSGTSWVEYAKPT